MKLTTVHPPTLLFAALAVAVYATAIALSGALPALPHPGAVAAGATLDLVVLVPAAFYLLVARPRGLPLATLAPVLLLSALAAAAILPSDHHRTLRFLELLLVPLEAALLGSVAWRALAAARRARGAPGDPLDRIRAAARDAVPIPRAAEVLTAEVALFHYAFGAWRARPHCPAGAAAFTQHRRSGAGGIAFALVLLTLAEAAAVHLLLARWSATAAWVLTLASLYGALWLVADHRATVLRPILVDESGARIRAGLRWDVRLPPDAVVRVQRTAPDAELRPLRLPLLGEPTRWLVLREPVEVRGPYGFTRRAGALGLAPDDPDGLCRALGAAPAVH